MKLILSIIFILFTTKAFAAITLNNVVGASNYDIISNNTTSSEELAPIIYGGLAGSDCTGTDNTSTCDSCALVTSNASMACNTNRIYENLELTIYFSSDSKSGMPLVTTNASEDGEQITSKSKSSSTSQGAQAYITLTWNTLCNELTDGSSCSAATAGSYYKLLRVGIDANSDSKLDSNDDYTTVKFIISKPTVDTFTTSTKSTSIGINSLIVFPGDQKVYIESLGYPSSYPLVDNSIGIFKFSKVRIIYSTDASTALPNDPSKYKDLNILGDPNDENNNLDVSPDLIDGLINGNTYYFRYGSVDDAGNLSNVYADTLTAEPSETAGLLAEDINCFIATAAFGSTLDDRIDSLRAFRNQYLFNSSIGRKFVKLYYNFSPSLAEKINRSNTLKLMAQAIVWPTVVWVEAGMQYGFLFINLLILATFAIPMALFFRRRQKC